MRIYVYANNPISKIHNIRKINVVIPYDSGFIILFSTYERNILDLIGLGMDWGWIGDGLGDGLCSV